MSISINNYFRKSEFARNALTLTLGTSVAQAFPILFYPVLGRLFDPADFGLLATLTSITAILAVIATGKYENSILITRTKKDAVNVLALVLLISLVFLLISTVVFVPLSEEFSRWFKEPKLKTWIWICPLSAYAIIIFDCYNEWCVRNKYFTPLSVNKITNSAAVTLNKLFLGFVRISSSGLVLGDLAGRIMSAGGCILRFLKKDYDLTRQITIRRMRVLAKHYIDFPKFSLPDQLVDTVNTQLSTLMIAYVFLSTEVGFYAMARNVLSVPINILSIAVRDVFRQRANEEWEKKGNCKDIYVKVITVMLIIILPTSILLMIIFPDLFSILLGKNWRPAGIYARILMPQVAILFMFRVVSSVFIIANRMKESFIWQVYSISLTIISLSIGSFVFKSIIETLICYVIARCIANLTRLYLTYKYSKGIAVG